MRKFKRNVSKKAYFIHVTIKRYCIATEKYDPTGKWNAQGYHYLSYLCVGEKVHLVEGNVRVEGNRSIGWYKSLLPLSEKIKKLFFVNNFINQKYNQHPSTHPINDVWESIGVLICLKNSWCPNDLPWPKCWINESGWDVNQGHDVTRFHRKQFCGTEPPSNF